ncbi:MAG TPA: hypothetical protein VFR09_01640 [Alphaproteobacteria bacterium]|nr:hypothetical protein [Alphaproteobacteria bacterium]
MADGSTQTKDPAADARMQSLLTTFRQVGMPLLTALTETPSANASGNAKPGGLNPEQFNALIDSTITLSNELAAQLGASEDQLDAWVRWSLAGAASQVVAAHFKATSNALPADEAKRLAGVAIELQTKFKAQIPSGNEPIPNTVATFRAKMMEAMVPVIGAVAQYSFGRAEHSLLAEVAEKLIKTADQVTRALAPAGASPEQWRLLCWNVLKAAGQIYTESHYAEADRLLYMNPDDRAAYFAQHGQIVPMTQVWQAFNQRVAMLATLATYLDVPASAHLETQGWQ